MSRTSIVLLSMIASACAPAGNLMPPPPVPSAQTSAQPPRLGANDSAESSGPAHSRGWDSGRRGTPNQRLGHYASVNGLFGLVLDRTAKTPRALVDGKTEVLELAVRDRGDNLFSLVSARDELVLDIDSSGRITMETAADPAAPLRRDGDAERLAEPKAPAVDATLTTAEGARLKEKCGAPIQIEIAGKPPTAASRGVYYAVERSTRALEQVCRDQAGQAAIKSKVRIIRIAHDAATRTSLDGGVLTVQGDLEGPAFGPFTDEIRHFVESKL